MRRIKSLFRILAITATVAINSSLPKAIAQPISIPQQAPYTNDAYTVLLEHFDGTSSGSTNGAVSYTNAVFGQGVHLNIGSWISWNHGRYSQATVEFWGKLDTLNSNGLNPNFIQAAYSQFYAPTFAVFIKTNKADANYHCGCGVPQNWVGGSDFNRQSPITPNTWHHYAVTWGSQGYHFYIDGSLNYSNSNTYAQNPSTAWWAIGGPINGGTVSGAGFTGVIDELRISNIQRTFAASPLPCLPHGATATAAATNGFVVAATVTDGGCGYTNTPLVRFISGSGSGSGAQAEAVVSNGVVIAVNVMNAGSGYTNTPIIVIDPLFIPNPVLSIAPMSSLSFSNLTLGGVYQLQQSVGWYWSNQSVSFTATNTLYRQMVSGVASIGDYRLALNPVPAQAFATAQVVNGFVVGATVTSGGSGYVTSPAITFVAGGGTNATAISHISGGAVTSITITAAGIDYTNAPTVQISQPPAAAASPTTVLPVMRVDATSLAPYDNYQVQFKPALSVAWGNWNGGLFSPTDVTNSQYLFITNAAGFFRLQYVP